MEGSTVLNKVYCKTQDVILVSFKERAVYLYKGHAKMKYKCCAEMFQNFCNIWHTQTHTKKSQN